MTYWATLSRDLRANTGNTKGRFLVWSFRTAALLADPEAGRIRKVLSGLWTAPYRFWCGWILGFELPANTVVGPGLRIYHGQGIVVHPLTRIGSGVTIRHGCTLGTKTDRADDQDAPVVGDYVVFGAGSAAIGGVTIGDHAVIGAGAVVTADVPERSIVVGVPGRVIGQVADVNGAVQ